MARFNPFDRVSGKYGAPMGRAGDPISFSRGDGYYDRGGAFCTYVEAHSPAGAIRAVMKLLDES
jgi:hypothetical protein